ncbi:MAG: hypothetical protein JWP44_5116, partial [Mucilaginibacter sp.]|nr:hypothetical protein [Mucilaginibacter sp.]
MKLKNWNVVNMDTDDIVEGGFFSKSAAQTS